MTQNCNSDQTCRPPQCDCKQQQSSASATAMAAPPYGSALNCRSRYNMSTHTALEYCSQKLSDIAKCGVLGATRGSDPPRLRAHNSSAALQAELSKPFCLFCEDEKCSRMLCERNMVSRWGQKANKILIVTISGTENGDLGQMNNFDFGFEEASTTE